MGRSGCLWIDQYVMGGQVVYFASTDNDVEDTGKDAVERMLREYISCVQGLALC